MNISSRIITVASAAACFSAIGGFASLQTNASASESQSHSPTTIHVIATLVDDRFFNPGGAAVDFVSTFPQIGAQDVFHDTLATPSGQPLGDDGGVCTVTTTGKTSLNTGDVGNAECAITFSLPGGQITVQQLSAPPPNRADQAVTGGTGKYRGARGDCVVTFPAPKTADLVFHLTNVDKSD